MKKNMRSLAILAATLAALSAQANLLSNAGFESDFAEDWNPRWGTFSRENWPNGQPEGNYAAYIRADWSGAGEANGGTLQSVPAQAGVDYVLTAQVYTDNGFQAESKALKLEFFDADNNLLDSFTSDLAHLKPGQWVKVTLTGKSPPETAKAQVVFEAMDTGDSGVLGVDALDLAPASP